VRQLDGERHPQDLVMETVAMPGRAVLEELLAVIAGEDDQRRCINLPPPQRVEHLTHAMVHPPHLGQVERPDPLPLAWVGNEEACTHVADVDVVEAARPFPLPVGLRQKAIGRGVGSVRIEEVHPQEERDVGVRLDPACGETRELQRARVHRSDAQPALQVGAERRMPGGLPTREE
jgi:hypothetical protein